MSNDTETLSLARSHSVLQRLLNFQALYLMSVNGDTRFCLVFSISTKDSEVHFKIVFHKPLTAQGGSL